MPWKRIRLTAAWLVGLYLAFMYVRMGWIKFDPEGFFSPAFERWGYPDWLRIVVGAVETAGGLAILIPWVASWGGLALAGVMVGAWVTRLNDGNLVDVAWITAYLLALIWIAWEWWGWRRPRNLRRKPDSL